MRNKEVQAQKSLEIVKFYKLWDDSEKMYKNNSNGNWLEFADGAVKHKWVNQTIDKIREDGYIKKPIGSMPKPWWYGKFEEKKDSNGRPFIKLPRLGPCDYYFIHNPDKYYK